MYAYVCAVWAGCCCGWVRRVSCDCCRFMRAVALERWWAFPWMSHATHVNESCHTYEWIMAHVWLSHATRKKESFYSTVALEHFYGWVMSHEFVRHLTHRNEMCHTLKWVMALVWMSLVMPFHTYEQWRWSIFMNESCHICEWVITHMWMSHVIRLNESWRTYEWVTSCHTHEQWHWRISWRWLQRILKKIEGVRFKVQFLRGRLNFFFAMFRGLGLDLCVESYRCISGGGGQRIWLKVASTHTRTHTHYHTHTGNDLVLLQDIGFLCKSAEEIQKWGSVSQETWVNRLLKLPGLVQKVLLGLFSTERGKRDLEN